MINHSFWGSHIYGNPKISIWRVPSLGQSHPRTVASAALTDTHPFPLVLGERSSKEAAKPARTGGTPSTFHGTFDFAVTTCWYWGYCTPNQNYPWLNLHQVTISRSSLNHRIGNIHTNCRAPMTLPQRQTCPFRGDARPPKLCFLLVYEPNWSI